MLRYHDFEWGKPVRNNDVVLFELLIIETAQAGLSWLTVLKKREAYRQAYKTFQPPNVARFIKADEENLLRNAEIIRNSRKISSSIQNAKASVKLQNQFGSFSNYLWSFDTDLPIVGGWSKTDQIPVESSLSRTICKDMRVREFKFIGPKIIYSYLQAVGVINDHVKDCFRFFELTRQ